MPWPCTRPWGRPHSKAFQQPAFRPPYYSARLFLHVAHALAHVLFFFGSCAMRVGVFARVLGDRIFRKAQTIAYTVLLRWKFFIWRKKRRATISAIVVAFGKHLFSHETYCIAHFALGGMHTPYLLPGGPRANWRKGDLGQHSVIKANWGIKEYRSWQVHWRTTLLWKA